MQYPSFKTISFLLVGIFCLLTLRGMAQIDMDSSKLNELIDFSIKSYTDEFMLIHKNEVLHHWENKQCDSSSFNTASMVKSWTGLVIGLMIDSGLLDSENDQVCKYLPEWKDGCENNVTIKHLLTMSAGINQRRGAQGILAIHDMHDYALNMKLDTFPNVRFSYSNESVQLLGLLIEKVSGKTSNDFYKEILFNPLGMHSTRLGKDPSGNDIAFGGAKTTIEDAAKIALLMLNNGKHNGHQFLSSDWVRKSVTPSEKAAYYGYLWWIDGMSEDKNYAATGDFGQMTIVFPDLELIYLRRQSCNKDISGNMNWMGPHFLKLIASIVK